MRESDLHLAATFFYETLLFFTFFCLKMLTYFLQALRQIDAVYYSPQAQNDQRFFGYIAKNRFLVEQISCVIIFINLYID